MPNLNKNWAALGLADCAGNPNKPLALNPNEPLVIIVHGCNASSGRFLALADVYAFHGQQTACFNYNDRDNLEKSSADFLTAINALSDYFNKGKFLVLAHSQGGLVARRALINNRKDGKQLTANTHVSLVTISSPFNGIQAAAHCGSTVLAWLSLGLTQPICHMVTGDKYKNITSNASFITAPGQLVKNVDLHFRVFTNEENTCRISAPDGTCVQTDYVFSVAEQIQPAVDATHILSPAVVNAGHVEIVGDKTTVPTKLIALLQQQGLLNNTPEQQRDAFKQLLNHLYAHNSF